MWDNIYAPEVAEHFFQLPEHIIEAEMDIERVASFEQAGKEVVTEIKKSSPFREKSIPPNPSPIRIRNCPKPPVESPNWMSVSKATISRAALSDTCMALIRFCQQLKMESTSTDR